MSELLPCPFCGQRALMVKHEGKGVRKPWYLAACVLKGCAIHPQGKRCDSIKEAETDWNRRPEKPQPDGGTGEL